MDTTAAAIDVGQVVLLFMLTLAVALLANRLRFPYTLALVLAGLVLGIFHVHLDLALGPNIVLFIFLPALLFEGAWNIDTSALRANWQAIALLAGPGLVISLAVTAGIVHWGTGLPWLVALLLGAIVSPTDPVAVIGLLRQLGMPERLRVIIEGESLFNDGVGAVAFELTLGVLLLSLGDTGSLAGFSIATIVLKGLWLLLGGVLIGAAIGYVVSHMVAAIDDPLLETTVTFSVAYGSYTVAVLLGTSGLLAVVAAGLIMGSYGRRVGMSERTLETVDHVWEFTGYLANSLLFLLLGVSIGAMSLVSTLLVIGWAVLGVVVGRAFMIFVLLRLHDYYIRWLGHRERKHPKAVGRLPVFRVWRPLLLFAGLRGALSIALVLSLPDSLPYQSILKPAVYGVVLVTLVGQGIGLHFLLPHWPKAPAEAA
ncbi:MAG TPA: sodium:proton antiporter [Ktedonobacterales bacterium]